MTGPSAATRRLGPGVLDVAGAEFSWRVAWGIERGVDRATGREIERGAPVPPPVLFLHGLMGSRWSWEPQLAELSHDRVAVAWDAPGYGTSSPLAVADRSFAGLADAVVRWADELDAARFHLVGLSFGGMIAQYVAARHPARLASVSLLATSPKFGLDGVTTPESWRAARLAALDAGQQPGDLAPSVLRAIAGPGIADHALAEQARAAHLVSSDALRQSIDILVTHDSRALLADIPVPTLCMVGELDAETPLGYAEAIAKSIPAARLVVVPAAGHVLNAETPERVNAELRAHFAAHDGGVTSESSARP